MDNITIVLVLYSFIYLFVVDIKTARVVVAVIVWYSAVTAIQDIWMNFTVDYIQNLYTSIPRRILAVIRSKAYLTKY
jgi:hypothetical protein